MILGIVGLPNSGKSTLFNALIRAKKAEVAAYPFCTIEPNIGVVEVPDKRLDQIKKIFNSEKAYPAIIKFLDIAGLIKGAHKGEGLGNQFLAHIRECDAILNIIRGFENPDVPGEVNPKEDLEIIKTELLMKDLETLEKRIQKISPKARTGDKEAKTELEILNKLEKILNEGKNIFPIDQKDFTEKEKEILKELYLLAAKPILYVINVSEKDLNKISFESLPENSIYISAKLEMDLIDFSKEEAQEYLASLGIKESVLDKLIKESYKLLDLITFFTANQKEARAWPVKNSTSVIEAAGMVHSDFKEKFVSAEVINFNELKEFSSYQEAKEKGMVRLEGKNYLVKDGDVIYFRHG